MTRLTSADAAWLHMDRPTNLMIITSLMWFDEPVDWERLRTVYQERLLDRYPRFTQRVVEHRLRGPVWEDDPDFDLDRHVTYVTLPAPGDKAALETLVSQIMSEPLPSQRPLWHAWLVDGYQGNGAAVISRIHHCVADGISLARVLLSLTDDPNAQEDAAIAPADNRDGSRLHALTDRARELLHSGLDALGHPDELLRLTELARDSATATAKLLLLPPDHRTVLKGKAGEHKYARWTRPLDLVDVKETAHRLEVTVNDVLLACFAGALHRYLDHRDSVVDTIRAVVPFNLRPLDEPVPAELGNDFGLVFCDVPVGPMSPRERIQRVHAAMQAIKDSPEGAVAYGILGAIGMTPAQVEQVLIDVFAAKGTLVCTNVPGPRHPVAMAGTEVAGVLAWVPSAGSIAHGVSIFSYAGTVSVGIRVDARLVPDPDWLVAAVEEEFATLAVLD